jgi:hypothetical protein
MRNASKLSAGKPERRLIHRWDIKILNKHNTNVKITAEQGPLMVSCKCSKKFKYYTRQKTIHCIEIRILFTGSFCSYTKSIKLNQTVLIWHFLQMW